MTPVIIVGTGIAGYTIAREFRKLDTQTPLLLVTADDGCSYPKPLLSNALTKGKAADQIAMFDASTMESTLNTQIITHQTVRRIDPKTKAIIINNDRAISYKKLVLAVGADPVRAPIVGDAESEVLSINNLVDYTLFREKLTKAKHITLIGPGLIGCEFANDLINSGFNVSIIGPDPYPMSSLLPERVAVDLKIAFAEAGVDWHLNLTASKINFCDHGYELTLSNGEVIKTDLVVSAVGLRPNVGLAERSGLAVDQGIVTDNYLQTNQEDIFALGDCAQVAGHNLLYIAPIIAAAKALAKTLANSIGTLTAVNYPAMPIMVKMPSYPLVLAPPPSSCVTGNWHFEMAPAGRSGIKGLFLGEDNNLLGYALSCDMVNEKQALTKQLPQLLP
ncbi:MAG: FAD-dependent oxidoreductase [Gammaproteobacteria bacterium]|nr:FAD-dependent oxidoreductase [Gammaproteobacteria bacterium]MDH5591720.1 FAD-dependent oxidoreductase [Gammaproteobacteria bacterium]